MKKNDLSIKKREELIAINANYAKVVCQLCIMLIVFMITTFLLLVYR